MRVLFAVVCHLYNLASHSSAAGMVFVLTPPPVIARVKQ